MKGQRVTGGSPTTSRDREPRNATAAQGVGARRGSKIESGKQTALSDQAYRAEAPASTTRLAALRAALAGVSATSLAARTYRAAIQRVMAEGGIA